MATCSPSELLASGSCFQCLTKKELQIVIAQLLCEIQSGGGGGGSSPKVYRALLSQSGTDAPVATVLKNTLGGTPVWTRANVGNYRLTLAGAFPSAKTFILAIPDSENSNANSVGAGWSSNDELGFWWWDAFSPSQNVDLGGGLSSVEVLVYP